jgi:hypothetical protein
MFVYCDSNCRRLHDVNYAWLIVHYDNIKNWSVELFYICSDNC